MKSLVFKATVAAALAAACQVFAVDAKLQINVNADSGEAPKVQTDGVIKAPVPQEQVDPKIWQGGGVPTAALAGKPTYFPAPYEAGQLYYNAVPTGPAKGTVIKMIDTTDDKDYICKLYKLKYTVGPEIMEFIKTTVLKENGQVDSTINTQTGIHYLSVTAPIFQFPYIEEIIKEYDQPGTSWDNSGKPSVTYKMKHRLASEVGKFILQEKMSRDGAVYSDDSINTLYFCDVPSQVVDAQTSLPDWDTPPDMVRIEVQIVELECDDDFNFGLDLNAWKEGLPESVDLNFDIRNSKNNSQAVAIGNPDGTARYFATTLNLNGMRPKAVANFINYMCVKGKAKVISRPVIVARNGQSATISSVDKISYMAYSAATAPLTQQAEVGITVNIKPIIGSETVTLNIQASVNSLMGFSQSSAPLINTRNTLADVVLKNGELFTLSGLRKDTITKMDQRVPFFGYIPLLGYFFRQEIDAKKTYEIVVLLTPEKVTPTTGSTAKEKEALAKIKEEIEKEKEDKNFFVEKFILNENP